MTDMNFVDFIIIGIAIISTAVGIFRGFIKEIFSIITWVLAAYLGYSYGNVIGQAFSSIETVLIRQTIGGGIIFFSILIVGGICGHILSKVVKFSGMSILDKFLGGGLGAVRAGLIVLILVPLLASTATEEPAWQNSTLVPRVQAVATQIMSHIPEQWVNSLNEWSNNLTG